MLKNIPNILPPELLKILAEMGHSDRLVIADANFPSESKGQRVVRLDGHGVLPVLEAILQVMPLDQYIARPIKLIEVDKGFEIATPIWDDFARLADKYDERNGADLIEPIDRFDFYKQTESAYAVVATGETALYACLSLQKGVVFPD